MVLVMALVKNRLFFNSTKKLSVLLGLIAVFISFLCSLRRNLKTRLSTQCFISLHLAVKSLHKHSNSIVLQQKKDAFNY